MKIRNMRATEIDFAHQCTTREGWISETRESFEAFYNHDPNGCFVAEMDDRPIGICVATSYGSNGFIGELIVIEEMRGRAIGRKLMEHTIHYLEGRGARNILLDGDLLAVPLYERIGFRKICRSLRFVGRIEGRPSPNVRPMGADDLNIVCAIDREAFGADRRFFLERRFMLYPDLCRVLSRGDVPTGFIMGFPGDAILSIGPWTVHGRPEEAAQLLDDLARQAPDTDLRIGVLENNRRAVDLVRSYSTMDNREPSWRMVLGPSAHLGSSEECFSIGTAAKG